ncbi:molecular chaperone DnaJ [Pontibacillus halophilus JSM 076056 = DSM 19796]|uniref:Molecular chaperone DnaJ n=1 Tax=Pontibacillus halophilus JSM 076056 = DSM 19796 TaxID=1385510 RepID=A0A0A5GP64_9BACI|nr:DUF1992 domain-containing protein [Pontibacillus halophilus]KGX92998.1 molecular chaperone DnaJ [Pontibacillus halophilus JSM 076056 = DSM 19796]
MDFSFRIAEERIKEAERNGEFKDLPGKGKRLDLSEWEAVPQDLRMSYTIMKNANMLPEEMNVKKEILELEDLLRQCDDEEERQAYRKKLSEKQIHFDQLMEKRKMNRSSTYHKYQTAITRRLFS